MERSILVIRSGALGDTILTIPLLESVRARHPDAEIAFAGNPAYRDLIPSGINVQAVDAPDRLWLFGDADLLPMRGCKSWDKAYVVSARHELITRNLKAAGTKSVAGTSSSPAEGRHVVQSMHEGLGLPVPEPRPVLPHLVSSAKRDVIWVHPGSGGRAKCLPLGLMTEFARGISRQTGRPPVVTAGEADGFLKAMPEWERLMGAQGTRLFEGKTIVELCTILGGSRLFIGNDSGMSHLAANLGIPSIVLYVTTDPAVWAPWVPSEMLRIVDLRCEIEEAVISGILDAELEEAEGLMNVKFRFS